MTEILLFSTEFNYQDRNTKPEYVWRKYKSILQGQSILDVGADECLLKNYIDETTKYWGIGIGGTPDQQVNLEIEKIPFESHSFDIVLCLDVLEHIENIHEIFDELCRVTQQYVIISLPNPWYSFFRLFSSNECDPKLKFYGLPLEYPEDRHKWFFSAEEAESFITYRAKKNNMSIIQLDYSYTRHDGRRPRYLLQRFGKWLFLNRHIAKKNLNSATLWCVLKKNTNVSGEDSVLKK